MEKYNFRGKNISYHCCRPSDDTFYFVFGDGEFRNSVGEAYCIQLKYCISSDKWIAEIWWQTEPAETRKVISFEGSDEYITEQELEELKEFAKQYIKHQKV